MFEKLIGNSQVKSYLHHALVHQRIGNSLLFCGPNGVGKSLFAEELAKHLLCDKDPQGYHRLKIEAGCHPDLHIYRPEGKVGMHSIGAMRQFSEEVYMSPHESRWKIFIIQDAERMLPYSSNALLKTFEEPAQDAVIMLVSSMPDALLPTIRSRCRTVRFEAISSVELSNFLIQQGKSQAQAAEIAAKAHGSIAKALQLVQSENTQLCAQLIELLANGVTHYKRLAETASLFAESINQSKSTLESEVRSQLTRGAQELTATQKQSIEKEVEGAVALHSMQGALSFFDWILGWYRDMHLHSVNGDKAHLFHPDFAELSFENYQKGHLLSLELVQQFIADARLSLERSTALHLCLENLFLKLNLLK